MKKFSHKVFEVHPQIQGGGQLPVDVAEVSEGIHTVSVAALRQREQPGRRFAAMLVSEEEPCLPPEDLILQGCHKVADNADGSRMDSVGSRGRVSRWMSVVSSSTARAAKSRSLAPRSVPRLATGQCTEHNSHNGARRNQFCTHWYRVARQ